MIEGRLHLGNKNISQNILYFARFALPLTFGRNYFRSDKQIKTLFYLHYRSLIRNFVPQNSEPACRWCPTRKGKGTRGKSGQRRAFRFLTGRDSRGSDHAEEKNRHAGPTPGKGGVRVRRRGKSPPGQWRHWCCAFRKLKVHVNRRPKERAARPSRRVER